MMARDGMGIQKSVESGRYFSSRFSSWRFAVGNAYLQLGLESQGELSRRRLLGVGLGVWGGMMKSSSDGYSNR